MKNSRTSWKVALIVMLLTTILSTTSKAQWVLASVAETSLHVTYGLDSVVGRHTGNDILEYSSDIYEVSVWDDDLDTEPGLAFNFNNGTHFGYSTFTNIIDIKDPDVCLAVDGNGVVHALAVYYDGNNGTFVLEDWIWTGTSFNFNTSWASGSITFGTAVNIDSDDAGNFIIIYDDGTSNDISIFTGDISSTLNINNSGTPVATGTVSPGFYPDVCLYGDGSNRVTYTYVDDTPTNFLIVDSDDFNALANGGNSATQLLSDQSPTGYVFPRIACPNPLSTNATSDDWTVVVGDGNDWTIHGYNYNNVSGFNQLIYNDGSIFNTQNISTIPNLFPAVTYLYESGNVP